MRAERITGSELESHWDCDNRLGDDVWLGDRVRLGNDVRLGDRVRLGNDVRLGNGVWLGSRVCLGHDVRLGDDVWLGNGVQLGDYVELGNGVRLGNGVWLGDGVRLGNGVRLGACVRLGDSVRLGDYVQVPVYQSWSFAIHWHSPGTIRAGCLIKPFDWCTANVRQVAAEHGYPPDEQERYAGYVEQIIAWEKVMGDKIGFARPD